MHDDHPEVFLTVDGVQLPSTECVWMEYAPCGCMSGVQTVGDRFTLEQAEALFFDAVDPAYFKRHREQGFVMRLITREQYLKTPTLICPHVPQWGVNPRPVPAGHAWLIERGYFAKKTERLHCFADGSEVSLCGKKSNKYGGFKSENIHSHMECVACLKEAQTLAGPVDPAAPLPPLEGALI